MKKNFLYLLSFFSIILFFDISYSQEMLEQDSHIIENNGIQNREFRKFGMGFIEVKESFYQEVKKNIENYKSSNYFVDLLSLRTEDIKNVKPCKLINFNENYITAIELIKGKNEYKKDENGIIIPILVKYASSHIKYKDKNMKDEIVIDLETEADDEGECQNKIVIKNCNNANNGLNCLKQLPDECYIMLPPYNQATCVNLRTDKSVLISYVCSRDGCFLLNSMVR